MRRVYPDTAVFRVLNSNVIWLIIKPNQILFLEIRPMSTKFKVSIGGDLKTFAGFVNILNYMAQRPIILHAKAHVGKACTSSPTMVYLIL
jgi:hypothetical protein